MAILKVFNGLENGRSKYRDETATEDVLSYIKQEDKTHGLVGGWAVDPQNAAYEMNTLNQSVHKEGGVSIRHFVISLDSDVSAEKMFELAKEFSLYYGEAYQIVYAVHQDTKHIHSHYGMNTVNYQTKGKYRGTYRDLYDFENHCNAVLKKHGIKERLVYQAK